MAFPSPVPQTSAARPKSPPTHPNRKRANVAKRKRGGQPGNQNARTSGAFSVHQPGHLSTMRLRIKMLDNSYISGALPSDEMIEQIHSLQEQFDFDFDDPDALTAFSLRLRTSRMLGHVISSSIPFTLKQRALKAIASDPFDYFERGYKDSGISRDADSFFVVSKLSARNSPDSPLQFRRNWGGAGVGAGFATSLTDEQWDVLAPLIPPDPWEDWLTGQPPAIIAASRWGFTRYFPTGEANDIVIMQNYNKVLQRIPSVGAGLAPAPVQKSAKKRGRPRNQPTSPRALLDAIFWKLATGQTWQNLPEGFPPMRLCRKYYRRLFLSGRLYTLLLALYNHLRLEPVDPYLLLEEGLFITTPSQNIALSPHVPPTWQNYTALLFMQLARDAYLRLERNQKQKPRLFPSLQVLKGEGQLSTGKISGIETQQPAIQPLEQSLIGKKFQKIERGQKIIDRIVARHIKAQTEARKNGIKPVSPAIQNKTDLDAEQ